MNDFDSQVNRYLQELFDIWLINHDVKHAYYSIWIRTLISITPPLREFEHFWRILLQFFFSETFPLLFIFQAHPFFITELLEIPLSFSHFHSSCALIH